MLAPVTSPAPTIAPSMAAGLAELGAARHGLDAARKAWRRALVDGDLGAMIAARAALGHAEIALDRAEGRLERLAEDAEAEIHRVGQPRDRRA